MELSQILIRFDAKMLIIVLIGASEYYLTNFMHTREIINMKQND
jgi:hypothetical protein